MKKLIKGLLDFQRHTLPPYRTTFARLAKGQAPDCLFITCADSRVVPNLLVSTDPGDLFVVRNAGNMVAPTDGTGQSLGDKSEAAAVEYALLHLPVVDVVVCGHSGCGAMKALLAGYSNPRAPNLEEWLSLGRGALQSLERAGKLGAELEPADRLSQLNVLTQLEHLRSYPLVRERLAEGKLRLHGWWFDIANARVHAYRPSHERFMPIDEVEGEQMLAELEGRGLGQHSSAAA
jgi:carbonic anhydrase